MKDGTGREFDDELTHFLTWYLDTGLKIYVPHYDFVHFVEGVTGLTIYRKDQFQVQLFTATPNTEIPSHTHPNVDSYEVALSGMEFFLDGKVVLPRWYANLPSMADNNLSASHYEVVRVLPESPHSAIAGKKGGSFMSVQHWLNDVKPTSVGNDWQGDTMGKHHTEQINA
jgi:hypothetical protein|tara:strand:- start:56 stop:565 length:510 start_codon:yes stop_codon:yes gene_type:complete